MQNKMPVKVLEFLFDALTDQSPRRRTVGRTRGAIELSQAILAKGWAYISQLEDLLLETDHRTRRIDIEAFATYFELPIRSVFQKPRFVTAGAAGFRALSAMDAAALLVHLDDIGFDTDPMLLIEGLLPALASATHVAGSEWTVLAYQRLRQKTQTTIRADAIDKDGEWASSKLKDSSGRRLEFIRVGVQPYQLQVSGSKYRKPRHEFVTCGYCGYEYTKGDPEAALTHRAEHARVRQCIDPTPLKQFRDRLLTVAEPELVIGSSPIWMHRQMYERAFRFKREMQFDFTQWEGSSRHKNKCPESQAYLFADHTTIYGPGAIVGACAFWRDETRWRLRWVWVCPKMRRAGVLTRRWAKFLARYGDFELDMPLSEAMVTFIAKHGSDWQQDSIKDFKAEA